MTYHPEVPIHVHQIVRVRLVPEWPVVYQSAAAMPEQAVGLAMTILEGATRERLVVMHLSAEQVPLSAEVVAEGAGAVAMVEPRQIFTGALLANAAGVYLAHNRLAGPAAAADEVLTFTRKVVTLGAMLGVPIHDHLVQAKGEACSTAASPGSRL